MLQNGISILRAVGFKSLLMVGLVLGAFSAQAQVPVYINEVFINPAASATDPLVQSLANCGTPASGQEWIELYNPSKCDTILLDCYTLGSNTSASNNGSISFPTGTIIPPLKFLLVGGANVTGVDVNINSLCGGRNLCSSTTWSLENGNGWIALYKPDGSVSDAVFWTASAGQPNLLTSDAAFSGAPCFPPTACQPQTLKSASSMNPGSEIGYVGKGPNPGLSIARNVDGGSWQTNITPTPKTCNGPCAAPSDLALSVDVEQDETCKLHNGQLVVSGIGGVAPYQYLWENGNRTPKLDSLVGGTYTVTVTDGANCQFALKDTLASLGDSVVVIAAPHYVAIFNGDETPLSATSIAIVKNAQWVPITGLSCALCTDPVASPKVSTTYVVYLTDINGCIGNDTVHVEVIKDENSVFIPNAFTPDASTNGRLYVRSPKVTSIEWRIYDRWGKEVFTAFDQTVSWDGTDKSGSKLNAGVYVYYLKATFVDGKERTLQGNVTLLR